MNCTFLSVMVLLTFLDVLLSSPTTNRCPAINVSNGNLRCSSFNNDRSHCLIECNQNFHRSVATPEYIVCNSSIWQVRQQAQTVLNLADLICIPSGGVGDGRTFTFEDPTCGNEPCESSFSGITRSICIALSCCWEPEGEVQCKNVYRPRCQNYFLGITQSVCVALGCVYDSSDNMCYAGPTRDIVPAITTSPAPMTTTPDPRCDELMLNPHVISNCSNGRYYNSECSLICPPGYTHTGVNTIHCMNNGSWSNIDASCTEIRCDALNVTQGVIYTCSNGNNISSTCHFTCENGAIYSGQASIVCMDIGSWSNSTGVCEAPVQECLYRALYTPGYSMTCSNGANLGSICTVTCRNEYMMHGEPSMSCVGNRWSSDPVCLQTSGTCNFHARFYDAGLWVINSRKFVLQEMHRNPWEIYNACNIGALVKVEFQQVDTLVVQLEYYKPVLTHFEVFDENGNVLMRGIGSKLYFGNSQKHLFGNDIRVFFAFRYGSPDVYYRVLHRSWNVVYLQGHFSVAELATARKLSFGINRSSISGRSGSGICSMCALYT
ncbi:uncharacterized protein LOC100178987 [Ciona intestinalis]